VVTFSAADIEKVLKHRMVELAIPSIAELARRAGVDRNNLLGFVGGDVKKLGAGSRARVADALEIDQEELALLFGTDVIAVPIDLWRELRGGHEADDERREALEKQRERRELQPKAAGLPAGRW
jgi:hypothetical protein